jgi:hypothetical protein
MVLAQKQIQWNREEDLNRNPHSYAHFIFEKVAKNIDGEKTASSKHVAGKSGYMPAEN